MVQIVNAVKIQLVLMEKTFSKKKNIFIILFKFYILFTEIYFFIKKSIYQIQIQVIKSMFNKNKS